MSESEAQEALDWIHQHFVFILPEEKDRTLEGLIGLIAEVDVDGVIVDPWNELEHRRPAAMTETEYVSHALSKMRHHARLFNQHWWLVAHPTKLQKDKNSGQYLVPTLYDVAGSAHFRNKADFGVVAWRNAGDDNGPTTIFVQKVRFRWCGKIGQCDLYFDKVTGRYSERENVYPMSWVGEKYEETA
jgi:twinkle protein